MNTEADFLTGQPLLKKSSEDTSVKSEDKGGGLSIEKRDGRGFKTF